MAIEGVLLTSPLKDAILNDDANKIEDELLKGSDPNEVTIEGPALLLAVERGNREVVCKLLEQPTLNVNCSHGIFDSTTPFILAIQRGNREIAELILKHDSFDWQLNYSVEGKSPAEIALAANQIPLADWLRTIQPAQPIDGPSPEKRLAILNRFKKTLEEKVMDPSASAVFPSDRSITNTYSL